MLKDPFLHILTNAVSHGIEGAEERAARHKPPVGEIQVTVVQRGSEAHITVRDDGNGFNLERLRKAAEAQQVSVPDGANTKELIDLAFLPGVSSSQALTTLSGRVLDWMLYAARLITCKAVSLSKIRRDRVHLST